jgi:antitoxin MazE
LYILCRYDENKGEPVRVQVQKWGNSLALRIPKPFAEDAGVRAGTTVDLSVSEGRLLAAPIRKRKPRLKDLLARVNRKNLHAETGTGPAVGREVW